MKNGILGFSPEDHWFLGLCPEVHFRRLSWLVLLIFSSLRLFSRVDSRFLTSNFILRSRAPMVAGNWLVLNKKHMLHLKNHIYSTEIACLDNRFWEEIIIWAKRTRKVVLPHQKSASKVKYRRRLTMNQLFFSNRRIAPKKEDRKNNMNWFMSCLIMIARDEKQLH